MIRIRRAVQEDIPEITDLIRDGFQSNYVDRALEDFGQRTRDGTIISFVAVEAGVVVGHAGIKFREEGRVSFGSLVVKPDYQRRGIGLELVKARLEYLREERFTGTVFSDAVASHTSAQKVLYRSGFRPTDMRFDLTLPTVGFFYLFPRNKTQTVTTIYVPREYEGITAAILGQFCEINFDRTARTRTGDYLDRYVRNEEHFHNPNSGWRIPLDIESAPADIVYLLEHDNRHMCVGFKPFVEGDEVRVYAHMAKLPTRVYKKEDIKVIPEVRDLFEFVWNQFQK